MTMRLFAPLAAALATLAAATATTATTATAATTPAATATAPTLPPAAPAPAAASDINAPARGVATSRVDFHGWPALRLQNRAAEVVVVPAIGRVMQFRLRDDRPAAANGGERSDAGSGPFWSIRGIGKELRPDAEGWINFGGDKAWPAPQADWARAVGRGWPPPKTFDAVAHEASLDAEGRVQLLSPVDPAYGVRVRRTVALDASRAVMTIETKYEKVAGAAAPIGVWTITQLVSPEAIVVRLPLRPRLANGYTALLPTPPALLKRDGTRLSLGRHRSEKTMIATEGRALVWVGRNVALRIRDDSPDATDGGPGSAAAGPAPAPAATPRSQIYTSPGGDDVGYVELELLGPVRALQPGDSAALTVRYTLLRRRHADPARDAEAALTAPP